MSTKSNKQSLLHLSGQIHSKWRQNVWPNICIINDLSYPPATHPQIIRMAIYVYISIDIYTYIYIYIYIYYVNIYLFQFNSSKFSHIMPDEVREHLTRDQRPFLHPESLQTLQIPSSMTVFLLFSSPRSFSTGFRSEDWNGQSRSLVLCSVTHFCVVFEVNVWIIVRLENPNMAHFKISNRDNHSLFFYLLVFDRIHDADAMCLNKMSRTSSRNIGPQHKKYSSIFHCTYGVLFIQVFTKPILSVCCLKSIFFCFIWP